MKNLKRVIACGLLLVLVVALIPACGKKASKKESTTKKAKLEYYYTVMSGDEKGITQLQVINNKLDIWCTTSVKSSSDDKAIENYNNGNCMEYQERIFTLDDNCKFIATGGDAGEDEYDREDFINDYTTQPGLGLGFLIVVQNDKIVKIYTMS